jgi:glycogen(starch) synthase
VTRILTWANPYWPTIGGGPLLAARLMPALAAAGHELVVLADRRPDDLPQEDERDGVRIIRLPFRRALGGDLRAFAAARRRVIEVKVALRPQLIHLYSLGYAELFHYETAAPSVPVLATLHRTFPPGAYASDGIIGRTLRTADWVTACSRSVLEETCARVSGLRSRASAILNALPEPADDITAPAFDPPRLLCVGVAEPHKGFDVAIAAMADLLPSLPTLTLTVAGGGSALPALRDQARRLGIEHAVSFLGATAPDDVPALIRGASVVLMPSRVEPFGLVALEAAQGARAIIASRVGGLPEIVVDDETGLLVSSDDPSAIVGAVQALLRDPRRAAELGLTARRRARDHFSWKHFVERYDDIIRRLANR